MSFILRKRNTYWYSREEYQNLIKQIDSIKDSYLPASVKHPEVFSKYRGIHSGREMVLFGTGCTINYYSPIANAIYMGMNSIVYRDDIKLDYYVSCDYDGEEELFMKVLSTENKMIKFFGISNGNRRGMLIPEYMRNRDDVETFYLYAERNIVNDAIMERNQTYKYPIDISISPLRSYGTTYYLMMQIALWMHPKRIYLVGADCFGSTKAHGVSTNTLVGDGFDYRVFIKGWKYMKEFIQYNYPDIEVISVNPVGLRGLFADYYTDSYKEYVRRFE